MQNRHESHDLRAVRHMVRRVAPPGSAADAGKRAADQIVYHGHALCRHTQAHIRQKNIVVDQCRPVSDLHENILRHHAALQLVREGRPHVVVKQILRNPCALRLPVTPDAHRAVMNVVAPDDDIDRRVHFDPRDLRAAQLHHVIDMMNMVILDDAEYTAHAADDPALLAVMDIAVPDDMTSDVLLQPAIRLSAAD